MNDEERKKERKWPQIVLAVAIFLIFAALAWYYFSLYDRFNRANLEDFVSRFGAWAPLAYVAIYVISAPIPFLAPVISAVGGLLFGTLWGMLLVVGSATLSALIPFTMARQLGRDWVESRVKGKRLEEYYKQSEGSRGFTFIVLMRLIPVLPWEIQNYVAGLTRVAVPTFAAGTVLGILPGSFSLVFLGATATDPTSWQFYLAVGLKVVTALIPLVGIYIRNRRNKNKQKGSEEATRDKEENKESRT
ncbi:MAG: TVP38/TMEM64 family protein [Anaerolineae bacterium]